MLERLFFRLANTLTAGLVALIACSPSGTSGGSPNDFTRRSSGTTPLPCEVSKILDRACYRCHASEPAFGAPMAMMSWEDLHERSVSDANVPVFHMLANRITDPDDIMPPPPGKLTNDEGNLLLAWVKAGGPPGTGCGAGGAGGGQGGNGGGQGGYGGTGNTGGSGNVGGSSGDGGTGGVVDPGSCQTYNFVAHGQQAPGDTTPFHVAENAVNLYQCFSFKAPWTGPTHALRFRPLIDNTKVIHHWLLYESKTPAADGSSAACFGVHPDGSLLAGWAPGSGDWVMPPDVGMELLHGPDVNLVLEVHYYNGNFTPGMFDKSGVEVCATTDLKPNAATVSWLGTEGIIINAQSPGTAQGTCTPQHNGPINIIRTWPHMHKYGRGMKTDIIRGSGAVETLVDVPNFEFDYQYGYESPATVFPGDRLVTTCTFQNTSSGLVTFGPATENEMCYNFVIAYPANALRSAGLMARSCML